MEIIKKNYKKIISYGLIALGVLFLAAILIFHFKKVFCWHAVFLIVVGLTLFPLAKGAKK